jgi:thiol-disulfide isomerase/thioredoxin
MKSVSWFVRPAVILCAAALVAGCGPDKPPANGGDGATSGGNTDDGAAATGEVAVGKAAPELSGEPVGGQGAAKLADTKGQVTIVDFWATFCEPCRKSFPKYQEMVDKHAGSLVVIAVSVDDPEDVGKEEIQKFASEVGVSFPILWDKEKKTADQYKPPKMPTSYVIDKEGVLRHIHAGYTEDEAGVIDKEVTELLK